MYVGTTYIERFVCKYYMKKCQSCKYVLVDCINLLVQWSFLNAVFITMWMKTSKDDTKDADPLYVVHQAVVHIRIDRVSKVVYSSVAPHSALCAVSLHSSEQDIFLNSEQIYYL